MCGEVVVHMFGSLIWKVQQYPKILATVIEFVWNAIAAARKKESSEGDSNVIQLLWQPCHTMYGQVDGSCLLAMKWVHSTFPKTRVYPAKSVWQAILNLRWAAITVSLF